MGVQCIWWVNSILNSISRSSNPSRPPARLASLASVAVLQRWRQYAHTALDATPSAARIWEFSACAPNRYSLSNPLDRLLSLIQLIWIGHWSSIVLPSTLKNRKSRWRFSANENSGSRSKFERCKSSSNSCDASSKWESQCLNFKFRPFGYSLIFVKVPS